MKALASTYGHDGHGYEIFLEHLSCIIERHKPDHLFTTNADPELLWMMYLNAFQISGGERQHYNCSACREFVKHYGHLAVFNPITNEVDSAIWNLDQLSDGLTQSLRGAINEMRRYVARAKITGVFHHGQMMMGTPFNQSKMGVSWYHMHTIMSMEKVYKKATMTANQKMAADREEYRLLWSSLTDYNPTVLDQALMLLSNNVLARSEKVIGPVKFLRKLHHDLDGIKSNQITNARVWYAVASAPAGFCHIRSSMAGTLLDDLMNGLDQAEVKRRFDAKMHPLQYQRPQAAPTDGNIKRAEEIFAKLGAASALQRRRFATIDDVHTFWRSTPPTKVESQGIFDDLRQNKVKLNTTMVSEPISWRKFAATILPHVEEMRFYLEDFRRYPFAVCTTGTDPEAVPILQWDNLGHRNQVSRYFWHGGSNPSHFGITSSGWHYVQALVDHPANWHLHTDHRSSEVMFALANVRESRTNFGNAIFPEDLKSEFREVRSVIEAYSKKASIDDSSKLGHVAGPTYRMDGPNHQGSFKLLVAVRNEFGSLNNVEYTIDRME